MKILDTFSGIAGFTTAAQRVWPDIEPHAFIERDTHCQDVLKDLYPGVPIYNDIKEYKHDGARIFILTGGYPCQRFSTAHHGCPTAEDLSGFMQDVIREVKPQYVIAENVQRETIEKFSDDLPIFYRTAVVCIGAYEVGADHQRDRWFCVAYPHDKGELYSNIDAEVARMQSLQNITWGWEKYARTLRVPDGIPNRTQRFKMLGNAVCVPVIESLMRAIATL